ncbi:MAG TPA: phospholipase D family protein [Caldimonas sp.]|nr:phospholipase D family protein [Caldimonas sp.]
MIRSISSALRLGALCAGAALAGCASLPPPSPRVASAAALDTAETQLGRLAAASLAGAGPGESGFRLLPTGDFAFDARTALIHRAERTLDVQYYQIADDSIGLQLLRDLRDAAARGVRVRLLVDDLYTGGEDPLFRTFATLPNVEVRLFNPLPARGGNLYGRLFFSLHDFSRINHRMHNKLFIADNRFAVSGGRNMADEYFMRSKLANFIDLDVISAGPVVRELSAVFDRYWNSEPAWPVQDVVPLRVEPADASGRFDSLVRHAPAELLPASSGPLGMTSVDDELAQGRLSLVFANAAVFADAPAKVGRGFRTPTATTVGTSVVEELQGARFEVQIASPYFIPGPTGMALLKEAIDHGVHVIVFTNSLGATDEPLVHFRYVRYRKAMLKLGVTIYELSPDLVRRSGSFGDFGKSFGRLHAKVTVLDRKRVFIGSMNYDERSAWSNTESGLLIESPELAGQILALTGRDRSESVYRLRLGPDDEVQWVVTAADGTERVLSEEPHRNWLLGLKMFLLEPFASEDLL